MFDNKVSHPFESTSGFLSRLRKLGRSAALVAAAGTLLQNTGCTTKTLPVLHQTIRHQTKASEEVMRQVDHPAPPAFSDVRATPRPMSARDLESLDEKAYRDYSLAQVLSTALATSPVLRDLGGTLLRSPDTASTVFSRQIQQMDPRFGSEAALSAFDAQLAAIASFNQNDRLYNNSFYAGGATAFQQQWDDYQIELSKKSAAGSQMAFRTVADSDINNAPANQFYSSWNSWVEAELRQPLLQGGGMEFNRIAGPGSTPGVYNGIQIAKVNSDISDTDFQISLRDYISNLENAYWDLYLAYREFDARRNAWQQVAKLCEEKYPQNTDPDKTSRNQLEALLLEQQKLQLQSEMEDAMFGRLLNGTEVRNGATGGTLQAGGGVLAAERRLRLLMGLPATDGTIIRPCDEPVLAEILFDWDSSISESLTQRPEVQRQNLAVKKRELELIAAKNFLNPRLDAVGRYRVRGFGDTLIESGIQSGSSPDSAVGNILTGNHQEWMMGVELNVPIGFRRGHAAVAHAELNLARERTVQRKQQRKIVSNLTGAFSDQERAFTAVKNALAQYAAARKYLDAVLARTEFQSNDERQVDAVRRAAQAEIQLFRARSEYAIALKNIHYEKGSLLACRDLRIAAEPQSGGPQSPETAAESDVVVPPVPSDAEKSSVSADSTVGPRPTSQSAIQPNVPGSNRRSVRPPPPAMPTPVVTSPAAARPAGTASRPAATPAAPAVPAGVARLASPARKPAPPAMPAATAKRVLTAPTKSIRPISEASSSQSTAASPSAGRASLNPTPKP
ncbi:MAG UNVERIFIED_CONTAM: TolC family protein [Planctomycetaceae bacterium]|jgi:hypothetical protein